MNKGTWKISIGGSAFADYTDILEPEPVRGGPRIEEFMGYGATSPIFINLGNTAIVRSFTMTREHDTDTDAELFRQGAIEEWAGVATVILTHMDYSGTESTWTITNAKVEIEIQQRIGPTTISKITITGKTS